MLTTGIHLFYPLAFIIIIIFAFYFSPKLGNLDISYNGSLVSINVHLEKML